MFRKTARNFNAPAATCGKICVAEVEEIVPVGSLDPDCIHVPSIYVKRLILGAPYDKKIEFVTTRERAGGMTGRNLWLVVGGWLSLLASRLALRLHRRRPGLVSLLRRGRARWRWRPSAAKLVPAILTARDCDASSPSGQLMRLPARV